MYEVASGVSAAGDKRREHSQTIIYTGLWLSWLGDV